MIIRGNDAAGDWLWGQNGSDMLTGQAAIAQNVQTRLLCFKNDFPWNLAFGPDWWNLLSAKNPQAETGIILQTREVIIGSYGITAINSLDVAEMGASRSVTLAYDLSSIFSTNFAGEVVPV